MKGMVFTGLLDMVEQKFGLEVVDQIIEKSNLKSKGVYTSVGTYDYHEMFEIVSNLSILTKIDSSKLVYSFGLYFFDTLLKIHPKVFNFYHTAFDLLSGIETHIHTHVRKIYPDAELPYFIMHEKSNKKLILEYHSKRALSQFALGLMDKTLEHYKEKATIKKEFLNNEGTKVLFTLQK